MAIKQLPEVVAVGNVGKSAALGVAAETGEGGLGEVLLVSRPARQRPQALPGQRHHSREIVLPKRLGRLTVTLPEAEEPLGDGLFGGHRTRPSTPVGLYLSERKNRPQPDTNCRHNAINEDEK